jgi:exopolysaccharide production protein ExoZ
VTEQRRSIGSIQALRGIAALLVMLFHINSGINDWFSLHQPLPYLTVGASGVDMFFVISGFIIVITSQKLRARDFVIRRLLRLVPIYWLSTVLFFVAFVLVASQRIFSDPAAALIHSLLFLPYERLDGSIQPVNPVGWTLNYEMQFYVVFALGLAMTTRASVFAGLLLLAAVLSGGLLHPSHAALRFWTAPILLEFVAGMVLGHIYLTGFRFNAGIALAVVAAASMFLFTVAASSEPTGWWRIVLWGGPAFAIVAAAALSPNVAVPVGLVQLGNISYSLYLLHLPVLLVFKRVGGSLGLDWSRPFTSWVAAAGLVALSVAVATVSFVCIERPLTRLGRSKP